MQGLEKDCSQSYVVQYILRWLVTTVKNKQLIAWTETQCHFRTEILSSMILSWKVNTIILGVGNIYAWEISAHVQVPKIQNIHWSSKLSKNDRNTT